ncbi:MAG: hypothetical protein ACOVT5_11680 [Armatimonadaceae bacterium]
MTSLDLAIVLLFPVQLAALAWVLLQTRSVIRRAAATREVASKALAKHARRAQGVLDTAQQGKASVSRIRSQAMATRKHLAIDDVPGFIITPRLLVRLASLAYGRTRKDDRATTSASIPVRILQGTGLMPPAVAKCLPLWRRVRPFVRASRRLLGAKPTPNARQETANAPTNGAS